MKKLSLIILMCFLVVGCSSNAQDREYLSKKELIKKYNLKIKDVPESMKIDMWDNIEIYENDQAEYYIIAIDDEVVSLSFMKKDIKYEDDLKKNQIYPNLEKNKKEIKKLLTGYEDIVDQSENTNCIDFKYKGKDALLLSMEGFSHYDIVFDSDKIDKIDGKKLTCKVLKKYEDIL